MKIKTMGDFPDNLATFVCPHVFADIGCVKSVSMDGDGDIAASCGCDFSSARIIAYSFVKAAFPDLMGLPAISPNIYYERETLDQPWVMGPN